MHMLDQAAERRAAQLAGISPPAFIATMAALVMVACAALIFLR